MGFLRSLMSVISTDGKTGTPFKLDDRHTVYFKGNGVTKLDAAHVAGFLKGYGYFTDTSHSDVQISSAGLKEEVKVGFIIGGKSVPGETEIFFRNSVRGLQEFFPGRAITVHLLDTELKELKSL